MYGGLGVVKKRLLYPSCCFFTRKCDSNPINHPLNVAFYFNSMINRDLRGYFLVKSQSINNFTDMWIIQLLTQMHNFKVGGFFPPAAVCLTHTAKERDCKVFFERKKSAEPRSLFGRAKHFPEWKTLNLPGKRQKKGQLLFCQPTNHSEGYTEGPERETEAQKRLWINWSLVVNSVKWCCISASKHFVWAV